MRGAGAGGRSIPRSPGDTMSPGKNARCNSRSTFPQHPRGCEILASKSHLSANWHRRSSNRKVRGRDGLHHESAVVISRSGEFPSESLTVLTPTRVGRRPALGLIARVVVAIDCPVTLTIVEAPERRRRDGKNQPDHARLLPPARVPRARPTSGVLMEVLLAVSWRHARYG